MPPRLCLIICVSSDRLRMKRNLHMTKTRAIKPSHSSADHRRRRQQVQSVKVSRQWQPLPPASPQVRREQITSSSDAELTCATVLQRYRDRLKRNEWESLPVKEPIGEMCLWRIIKLHKRYEKLFNKRLTQPQLHNEEEQSAPAAATASL